MDQCTDKSYQSRKPIKKTPKIEFLLCIPKQTLTHVICNDKSYKENQSRHGQNSQNRKILLYINTETTTLTHIMANQIIKNSTFIKMPKQPH